jgi:PAS domain S-box-containing protein
VPPGLETVVPTPAEPHRGRSRTRHWLAVAAVAAIYYAAARFGLLLAFEETNASPVWPPSGIALAAMLVLGPGVWPGVLLGAFLANVAAFLGNQATDALHAVVSSFFIGSGNTLEAACGAWLLGQWVKSHHPFGRREVFRFVAVALVISAVSAAVGPAASSLAGVTPWTVYGTVVSTWWLGDVAGILIVTPMVLAWWMHGPLGWRRWQAVEAALLFLGLFLVGHGVFRGEMGAVGADRQIYLFMPLLLWAVFRFGMRGATTAVAVASGFAIWGTVDGSGPFVGGSLNQSLALLQLFICVISVTFLALSAALEERRQAQEELLRMNESLEARISERTETLAAANAVLEAEIVRSARVQRDLELEQARLSEAEHIAALGSWEWDIPRDRVTWSPELCRIYGLDADAFPRTYHGFLTHVHPDDREALMEKMEAAFQQGTPLAIDHRILRPDGAERVIQARGRVVLDDAGMPVRMRGTGQDVTELEQAQRLLERNEAKLAEAQRVAHLGIWEWEVDSDHVTWSDELYRIYGREPHQFGHTCEDYLSCVHPDDRTRVAEVLELALQQRRSFAFEERIVRPDGSVRDLYSRGEVTGDAIGKRIRMFGVCQDITEHKEAQRELALRADELARSNAELERFASVASHDLKEPLRMVGSYVQLLARRYQGKIDGDADTYIGFVVDGVQRMHQVIEDLLDYARLGKSAMAIQSVDCEPLLGRVLAGCGATIRATKASVTHDPLPTVIADPLQLALLFQHLIDNALKFHSGTPRVHLSAERSDAEWVFAIRDQGIGIAPEYAERIFGIFQRLHGRDRYPGTGVGLAICKRVVDRHGGRIWVESRLDHGASFHFALPLRTGSQRFSPQAVTSAIGATSA